MHVEESSRIKRREERVEGGERGERRREGEERGASGGERAKNK